MTCEHETRHLTRTEYDGHITVLIDQFEGKRLNAPNDVVVRSDGSIWFTDPGYGILMNYEGNQALFEPPTRVYRLNLQTGQATVMAEDFDGPNGLYFSPDEQLLYIVDTGMSHRYDGSSHIRMFDVVYRTFLTLGCDRCYRDVSAGNTARQNNLAERYFLLFRLAIT
jgi:gluconolactonase